MLNVMQFNVALAKLQIKNYQLAHRIPVSASSLSKWKNIEDVPERYKDKLCKELRISRERLFGKEDSNE